MSESIQLSTCAACNATTINFEKPLMRCGKCLTTEYCSSVCQKSDWKRHKQTCTGYTAPAVNATSSTTSSPSSLAPPQQPQFAQSPFSKPFFQYPDKISPEWQKAYDARPKQISASTFFHPRQKAAYENLKNATLFTRFFIRATPQAITDAITKTPKLAETFLLGHLNNILVFDVCYEKHKEHIKTVYSVLKERNLKVNKRFCAFQKRSMVEAGFHINEGDDLMGVKGAFAIILREHLADGTVDAIDRHLARKGSIWSFCSKIDCG